MSLYYRVGPPIWLEDWSEETRYFAFYLLTNRHRNTEGLYFLPLAYAVADMKWTPKKVRDNLARLIDDGFVRYDEDASVLFICKALEWQGAKNPKQIKGAVRVIGEVPRSTLDEPFWKASERLSEALAKAFREAYPKRFEYSSSNSSSSSNTPLSPPRGGRDQFTVIDGDVA